MRVKLGLWVFMAFEVAWGIVIGTWGNSVGKGYAKVE